MYVLWSCDLTCSTCGMFLTGRQQKIQQSYTQLMLNEAHAAQQMLVWCNTMAYTVRGNSQHKSVYDSIYMAILRQQYRDVRVTLHICAIHYPQNSWCCALRIVGSLAGVQRAITNRIIWEVYGKSSARRSRSGNYIRLDSSLAWTSLSQALVAPGNYHASHKCMLWVTACLLVQQLANR